jgi:hypothetical protein
VVRYDADAGFLPLVHRHGRWRLAFVDDQQRQRGFGGRCLAGTRNPPGLRREPERCPGRLAAGTSQSGRVRRDGEPAFPDRLFHGRRVRRRGYQQGRTRVARRRGLEDRGRRHVHDRGADVRIRQRPDDHCTDQCEPVEWAVVHVAGRAGSRGAVRVPRYHHGRVHWHRHSGAIRSRQQFFRRSGPGHPKRHRQRPGPQPVRQRLPQRQSVERAQPLDRSRLPIGLYGRSDAAGWFPFRRRRGACGQHPGAYPPRDDGRSSRHAIRPVVADTFNQPGGKATRRWSNSRTRSCGSSDGK